MWLLEAGYLTSRSRPLSTGSVSRLPKGRSQLGSHRVFEKLSQVALLYSDSFHNFYITGSENCSTNSVETCGHISYIVNPTHPIQHKNWQDRRKHKLTASTFAMAIGTWRGSRVRLWKEKIDAAEPFPGNNATRWDKEYERAALHRYKLISRHDVQFADFTIYNENNPNDDWLAASPDGIITGPSSAGVLEIKCPFFGGNAANRMPWIGVPFYYMPQAQGLMEILDMDWLDLFCWTPRGSSLFRIPRDQRYWRLLRAALSDFWWKHVHPARQILSKTSYREFGDELRALKPLPRHELFSNIVHASVRLSRRSQTLYCSTETVLRS